MARLRAASVCSVHSRRCRTLILGIIVAVWHVPLSLSEEHFAVMLLGTVVVTFFYTWMFNHTGGSVFMTMVAHAADGLIGVKLLADRRVPRRGRTASHCCTARHGSWSRRSWCSPTDAGGSPRSRTRPCRGRAREQPRVQVVGGEIGLTAASQPSPRESHRFEVCDEAVRSFGRTRKAPSQRRLLTAPCARHSAPTRRTERRTERSPDRGHAGAQNGTSSLAPGCPVLSLALGRKLRRRFALPKSGEDDWS